ncbi:MAG: RyR domain-containing protein [Ferruginibacter sp.]
MAQLPDIELVSAEVHKAWMESKKANGISTRKSEEDEELMVPYEKLSEKAKDLDRNTVKAVYAAIKKLGK